MKKFLFAAIAAFSLTACLDEPTPPQPRDYEGTLVNTDITEDVTWYSDSIYTLQGRVSVESGVSLTIQPGCIIKGRQGAGSMASALVIARGGKIYAEGTPGAPIIFTSELDQIQPGQLASPNLDENINGLWGGLIVLGKAPISATTSPLQIEGIPSSDHTGLYGGTDSLDNSGIIRYVSIRHGGTNIGSGNEINGLTLGGVGKGTTIENIEVIANQDDGIEFFGGNVNVTNALVWNQGDDAFDVDQSWGGILDNFVSIDGLDHALELDGAEGTMIDSFTLINGTLLGQDTAQCHFRDAAQGYISITGAYNIEADAGTNVVVDSNPTGADLSVFNWTVTYSKGKL
jgi:hypothetical protein